MAEDTEAVGYCVGLSLGSSLAQQNLQGISTESIAKGIQDTFDQKELKYSPEEANQIIQDYLTFQRETAFKGNIEAGEKFLAENAQREEVKQTASGLQYEVITEGNGESPSETSQVTVHYHGTLPDGTVFDSSIERGQPASFGVNQVIKGWTEALQLMSVGAKYKLYIPQELAYGANPHPGGPIEPFMALVFDVELLEIA